MNSLISGSVSMNGSEYKKYHESFMHNNHGTTAIHTFFCIFFTVQCTLLCAVKHHRNGPFQYIYEYFAIVLPLILAHTIFANDIYVLNAVISLCLVYEIVTLHSSLDYHRSMSQLNVFRTKKIQTITCLRGLTYLITVLCILAVDFETFPRNLAKTEKYGFSLMDTGVGLFVLMSGLVHKDLRNHSTLTIIKSNVKFVTVLTLLGIARFVSVKQLDYQEHVTEYGVHWNFFFTLAVCKIIATFMLFLSEKALILSILTLVVHELLLYQGLQAWVFSDSPRIGIITANREGITSSLGYVALYLYGTYVKKELNCKEKPRKFIFTKLTFMSMFLWITMYCTNYTLPISRTLANASYCIYLVSVFTTIVSILYLFESLFQNVTKKIQFCVPLLLSAINENGLIYFLVANLLTGAVNMCVKTLFMSHTVTIIILNIYMIITLWLIVYLKKF